MNIQQLEYIIALNKHRHFLKASEACFVTQATLSEMIKKLEEELGVVLFDRNKRPVQPTDIGEKVILQAKISLQKINQIREIIKENSGEINGELKIGIIPSLAPYLLPLFLKQFLERYQEAKLIINELTTDEIIKQLKQGDIDVAILAIPLLDKELKEETLFYEEFYHYGKNLKDPSMTVKSILPSDINPESLLLLEEGHCLRNQIINLCELRNATTSSFLEYQSGSIETLKRMVDLEMGTTILPELSLSSLSTEQKSKISSFESPEPVREIGLVYHHHFIKKNLIQALKKTILETIPESMLSNENKKILLVK